MEKTLSQDEKLDYDPNVGMNFYINEICWLKFAPNIYSWMLLSLRCVCNTSRKKNKKHQSVHICTDSIQ